MIVIVGAGYAGAATALWLGRHGLGQKVILLEAEPRTGVHASGRNAGLITSIVDDDVTCALTVRGAEQTLAALSLGAADTLAKPKPGQFDKDYRATLLRKIRLLGRVAKRARELPRDKVLVVNLSGRGDKDMETVVKRLEVRP